MDSPLSDTESLNAIAIRVLRRLQDKLNEDGHDSLTREEWFLIDDLNIWWRTHKWIAYPPRLPAGSFGVL